MKKTVLLPLLILLFASPALFAQNSVDPCENAPALIPDDRNDLEWWSNRHQEKLNEKGREDARLLFVGDSITQGWEGAGSELWKEYYAPYGAHNIGFSGDRTEHVLWRLDEGAVEGLNPEVTILMIGTNNTGHRQEAAGCTAKGVGNILDDLAARLPEAATLLLSIFPRGETRDDALRQINSDINSRLAEYSNRPNVTWLDINSAFLTDDGKLPEEIMPDLLHPNETGYKIWAETMHPVLLDLLD